MNKFEEIMLKISKIFGLALLSCTLLLIVTLIIVQIVMSGAKLLEKKTPKVTFQKYDFVEASRQTVDEARPERKTAIMVKDAVAEMKPLYEKKVDAYLQEKSEELFKNANTREEKKASYRNDKVASFETGSQNSLNNVIQDLEEKFRKPYVAGLVKYVKEADNEGIEAFTQNKVPVASIAYSKVFYKYNQEFSRQMREIKAREQSDSGIQGLLEKSAVYIMLFFLISIFLMVSVMFAIIRIEDKIKYHFVALKK
ncbi:MAG TPA: hypothetical protein PLM53_05255 [Spirochaetota bacterium]|nr:hypothetical protein [Spirochaetota bacterium]HPC40566.1 hypothetical protein [Spirochaetota bacterium]HPL18391.1 hypothetical protein [Spirochaetota bacterium]HQF07926.1 hypothetical protein [Spirochaetota bacterium]HQH96486.1 hypothetical protein [Spirochaetota bacterium]